MSEDRLQILRMLEAGKVRAEEALRLLEALEPPAAIGGPPPHHLRITFTPRGGQTGTNLRVPVGMVRAVGEVLTQLGRLEGAEQTWRQVGAALAAGRTGPVVEVEAEGHRVALVLE